MDTRDIERRVNQEKAEDEERRGPAGHSQQDLPIFDALRKFHDERTISLAIPAHKSGAGAPAYAKELLGEQVFLADQTGLGGLDNRHESWEVQTAAQELFAEALGADQCLFCTNGSSGSVHSVIGALVGPGEKIALSRNSHKSVIAGLIHSGAIPVWLEPEYDDDLEVAHGILPETLEQALAAAPDCRAVLLTSPSYYGVSSPVPALAEIAHDAGLPLAVDDAWALAHKFHPELPTFGLDAGADLAIGSVHKTLSGLSQSSVIAVKGDRIDTERLSLSLETHQSTSGSVVLMASIDAARRQMVEEGEALLGNALRLARKLRSGARALGLTTIEPEEILQHPSAWGFNELHVTMDVSGLGITGYEAGDWLRGHHALAVELADHRRIQGIVSHADTDQSIGHALAALSDMADRLGSTNGGPPRAVPSSSELRTEQVMSPREAFYARTETADLDKAAGRVAAEFVTPYPPGIPLFAPGERITAEITEYLKTGSAQGIYVEGCADQSLGTLRVVA